MRPRLILVTLVLTALALTALALTALAPTGCQLVNMSRLYLANDWTAHRWNTDQDKVDLPLRLDSHVLVPIRVNGSEPLDFVLDTGTPMTFLVGSERTRHLGLRLGSSVALGGSGTGSTPTGRMVRQLTVSVGSVDLLNQTAVLVVDPRFGIRSRDPPGHDRPPRVRSLGPYTLPARPDRSADLGSICPVGSGHHVLDIGLRDGGGTTWRARPWHLAAVHGYLRLLTRRDVPGVPRDRAWPVLIAR